MLSSPALLVADHQLHGFACGVDTLDDWLKRRAKPNQVSGASRTYVVTEGKQVVGYYCLASGALELNHAPASIRRNRCAEAFKARPAVQRGLNIPPRP